MASIRRSIVVSILFTLFGGPGPILVFLPYWITRFRIPPAEPVWQQCLAFALILVGVTPLLASIHRFIVAGRGTLMPAVPTERLVASGLYRYVRNPMYVGVATTLCGETVLFGMRGVAIYSVAVCLMFHLFVVTYEEPTLTRRHPQDYPRYMRNVPRWLPHLKPWTGSGADSTME